MKKIAILLAATMAFAINSNAQSMTIALYRYHA